MRRWPLAALVSSVALVAALGGSASAGNTKKDPLPPYTFTLTIKEGTQTSVAFFKSVSGLKSETEVVEFREGGANESVHKLVGRTKWPNIVLKRGFAGVSTNDAVQQWARAIQSGQDVRKDIVVVIHDAQQNEIGRFELHRCFPVSWEIGPLYSPRDPASSPRDPASLDAPEGEMAMETIEIAHEGMEIK